jgi:hypothetical protein
MYDESPIDATYFQDLKAEPLDTDIGLTVPFEVYSSLGVTKDYGQFSPDFPQAQDLSAQNLCPLSVLDSVMYSEFPVDPSWDTSFW